MSIYQRYASGAHDRAFFNNSKASHRIISDIPAASANESATASANNYSPSTHIAYSKNRINSHNHSYTVDDIDPIEGIDNLTKPHADDNNSDYNSKDDKDNDDEQESVGFIQLNPLSGQFDPYNESIFSISSNSITEWLSIFPNAAYFTGYDESLFEHIVIIVYENLKSGKISTLSITKFGVVSYDNLILDSRSRFWPSCENLLPEHQKSNVRRALAITNLKNYNRLSNHPGQFVVNKHWDETTAGSIANKMNLLVDKKPDELGVKLLQLGLLQQHTIQSTILDVIYDNSSSTASSKIVEENNKLVFLLGAQLDQLFDPLLEYSPEHMDIVYIPPTSDEFERPQFESNSLIDSIVGEIINVQTNYTMGLVNLLQNFIIPLRVFVLASTPGSGITKVNQVFPPTIDEITRINCILHENLEKTSKLGYVEVFKVLGMTLPYFYKAFIRHEANLKNFQNRLNKFAKKNSRRIFENNDINKGGFSMSEIESIVSGSLLELPRLKLILRRLYDTVAIEKSKLTNFDGSIDEDPEMTIIESYYKSAIETIDAFGSVEVDEESKGNHNRIFTPTGKLLTELASNWPAELQYGWLSRKVVGIFELANVKEEVDEFHNIDIMIIFSDHILFLNIVDHHYYNNVKSSNKPFKKLSLADVLMHSLVNEKPLPSLSQFPSMKVKFWCGINDVIASTYKSYSPRTSSEEEYIRFMNVSKIGFRSTNLNNRTYTQYYQVLKQDNTNPDSNKIIELINKSKVLHKTQPFHLFKSYDANLHIYSTAHDKSTYEEEKSKSPFALFLNETIKDPTKFFEENPQIYLVLCASFINDFKIEIVGFNKTNNFTIHEIIFSEDLLKCLKEILAKNYSFLFTSYNAITEILTQGYKSDLSYYSNIFSKTNQQKRMQQNNVKQLEEPSKKKIKSLLPGNSDDLVPEEHSVKETNTKLSLKRKNTNRTSLEPTKALKLNEKNRASALPNRRKSFIMKIFDCLRKHDNSDTQHKEKAETQPSKLKISEPKSVVSDSKVLKESNMIDLPKKQNILDKRPVSDIPRNISNTPIPKGEKKRFSHIYMPIPDLERSNTITSSIDQLVKGSDQNAASGPLRVEDNFKFPNSSQNKVSIDTKSQLSNQVITEEPLNNSSLSIFNSSNVNRKFPLSFSNNSDDPLGRQPSISKTTPKQSIEAFQSFANDGTRSSSVYSSVHSSRKVSQEQPYPNVISQPPPLQVEQKSQSMLLDTQQPQVFRANQAISSYPQHQFQHRNIPTKKASLIDHSKPSHTPNQWSTSDNSQKTRVPSNDSQKRKSMTEENVLVLDTIPYKTRTNMSRGYDNIDAEDFYRDGETNWVTISRENSSLLENEVRALKEVTRLDSFEVINVKEVPIPKQATSTPMTGGLGALPFIDDNDTASIYYSPSQEPSPEKFDNRNILSDSITSPFGYKTNQGKEESVTSLTSSQYIREFGNQLESTFSKYGNLGSPSFEVGFDHASMSDNETIKIDSEPTSESSEESDPEVSPIIIKGDFDSQSYDAQSKLENEDPSIKLIRETRPTKPELALNLSSSEEEYFSSEDIARTITLIHNNSASLINSRAETTSGASKSTSPNTFNSSSSDATIINDYIQEATKQPLQEKYGARLLPTNQRSFDNRRNLYDDKKMEAPGFAIRYDSVAYLSDIINGTVNFNLNDEEDKPNFN